MNTDEMHKNVEKLNELDALLDVARDELQVCFLFVFSTNLSRML